ncbi:MAG: VOC family protein [Planctomycetota bacterium]
MAHASRRCATPRDEALLALVSLVVRDYDEAIAFFTDVLGFELVEDTPVLEQDKRWVVVAPSGAGGSGSGSGARLLLARASTPEQSARIGDQTGGRVFLFLETDDLARDHARLLSKGVTFVREPKDFPYGRVAVFEDLYGNLWDLIEPRR